MNMKIALSHSNNELMTTYADNVCVCFNMIVSMHTCQYQIYYMAAFILHFRCVLERDNSPFKRPDLFPNAVADIDSPREVPLFEKIRSLAVDAGTENQNSQYSIHRGLEEWCFVMRSLHEWFTKTNISTSQCQESTYIHMVSPSINRIEQT